MPTGWGAPGVGVTVGDGVGEAVTVAVGVGLGVGEMVAVAVGVGWHVPLPSASNTKLLHPR